MTDELTWLRDFERRVKLDMNTWQMYSPEWTELNTVLGHINTRIIALLEGETALAGPCSPCGDGDTKQEFHNHGRSV